MVTKGLANENTPLVKSPILKNYQIESCINNGRTLVLLVVSLDDQKKYAMKIYPYSKGNISPAYISEARFSHLSNEHIIHIAKIQPREQFTLNGVSKDASYLLMEYAPYGCFRPLAICPQFNSNTLLVRTYFKQLIQGLEYLHEQNVSHLDLKLDNLLLGEDFKLKIADFDTSYIKEDIFVLGKGTTNFRAPELKDGKCKKTKLADVYSAGIILFTLNAGILPYSEDTKIYGQNLYDLLFNDLQKFWEVHEKIHKRPFDSDFKALFESMTRFNPLERISLSEIKESRWYQGPCYSQHEVSKVLKEIFKNIMNNK
jgi:Serine/threonine protein kinase